MVSFRSVQSRYCFGPREKGGCLRWQLACWSRCASKAITIPKATSVQHSNIDPGPPPEQPEDDWVPAALIAERLGQKISLTPYLERDENPGPPSELDVYLREMLEAHLRGESLEDWPALDWLVLEKPEPIAPLRPPSAWSTVKGWLSKILRKP